MLHLIQRHAEQVRGIKPVPIATLALTDARWWRNAGIPPTSTAARPTAWQAMTNGSASRSSSTSSRPCAVGRRLPGRVMSA
jgi:hypothetical protein